MINNVEHSHFCQIICVLVFLGLISHLIKHPVNWNSVLEVNFKFCQMVFDLQEEKQSTCVHRGCVHRCM